MSIQHISIWEKLDGRITWTAFTVLLLVIIQTPPPELDNSLEETLKGRPSVVALVHVLLCEQTLDLSPR